MHGPYIPENHARHVLANRTYRFAKLMAGTGIYRMQNSDRRKGSIDVVLYVGKPSDPIHHIHLGPDLLPQFRMFFFLLILYYR